MQLMMVRVIVVAVVVMVFVTSARRGRNERCIFFNHNIYNKKKYN